MKRENDDMAIDILLASYFVGEADAAERAEVESWVKLNDENRKYFDASKKAWDASDKLLNDPRFNTEVGWNKLKGRLDSPDQSVRPVRKKYVWAAAASVALIISIVSILWQTRESVDDVRQVAVKSGAEPKNDTLPDQSIVQLNRNSTIEYASAFGGDVREVNLEGEAFFDVQRNEQQPFIIHAGIMEVRVLGTSFNVKAYPGEDSVHVSVETGRVQCIVSGDTVILTQGQYAVYDNGSGKMRLGKEDDPNRSAYRNRIFRFSDVTLASMIQQLNSAYGCNIILKNDELKSCRFSSTKVFNNEPVQNIIEAIKVTFPGITSQDTGSVIILDGTGCK